MSSPQPTLWKFIDAVKPYEVNWGPWLVNDTIIESTWTPDDSGIVVEQELCSFTDTTTMVWLSGGPTIPEGDSPAYMRCKVINHISTLGGLQEDFVLYVNVKSP
jgi:hypothetical protein